MVNKLKYGDKVKSNNKVYFITSEGVRTVKARKVIDPNTRYESLSNYPITLKKKDIKSKIKRRK